MTFRPPRTPSLCTRAQTERIIDERRILSTAPPPPPRARLPRPPPPVASFLFFMEHPSILISVVVFGHSVAWWQWIGVLCVFGGLSLSVRAKYDAKQGKVENPSKVGGGSGTGGVKSTSSGPAAKASGDDKKEL